MNNLAHVSGGYDLYFLLIFAVLEPERNCLQFFFLITCGFVKAWEYHGMQYQ